jgi:hypothetical protein
MEDTCEPKSTTIAVVDNASERYSELTAMRAVIQIPYVGGSIDTLLVGRGGRIQRDRVLHLISEIDRRLRQVETPAEQLTEDGLLDLMVNTSDAAGRTRSEAKRARYAQIVARQVARGGDIDDAEMALRMVADLHDLHVQVLQTAMDVPAIPDLFDGLPVVTIAKTPLQNAAGQTSLRLVDEYPHIPMTTLRMISAELLAKSLFHDEGVGRWDTPAMEYFVATDLAKWLRDWLLQSK